MSRIKINYEQRRLSKFNFSIPRGRLVDYKRHTYTHDDLFTTYPTHPAPPGDKKSHVFSRLKPPDCLQRVFPVIRTLKTYSTSFILGDVIAGLSVAFLHVPQGLAYGLLASLTPVSGLYTSLIPVIMYMVFGTCTHVSMGTNSVLSMITAEVVERELKVRDDERKLNLSNLDQAQKDQYHKDAMDFKLNIAMSTTFICGSFLLAMGIFRLGFVTSYMPTSFVGGFTTASAVHIATSQVGKALNIHVKQSSGYGKIVKNYIYIFSHISSTNLIDLLITIITLAFITTFTFINPKINAKFKFDVPENLAVVIIGTFISYFCDLKDRFGIGVVGSVVTGFPAPTVPDFSHSLNVLPDAILMALVVFSMTISMAMLMAKIHHYEIDPNQELIAYGICNMSAAPFMCHATSVSPARTMVLSNSKVNSMLHSLPTIVFLLSVILGLGHLFNDLPIAVLAGVVLAAINGLLRQVRQLPRLWRVGKTDFIVWLSTFLVTSLVDIGVGLVVGIGVAAFGSVVNNQRVQGFQIVKSSYEDVLVYGENRKDIEFFRYLRIFHFPAQLCYFNAEIFKKQLFKKVLDPTKVKATMYSYDGSPNSSTMSMDIKFVRSIIIDCSAMTIVDIDGINVLKVVVLLYNGVGIQILMARVLPTVFEALERASFFSILPRSCVFYDLRDALENEHLTREGVSILSLSSSSHSPPSIDDNGNDNGNDNGIQMTKGSIHSSPTHSTIKENV